MIRCQTAGMMALLLYLLAAPLQAAQVPEAESTDARASRCFEVQRNDPEAAIGIAEALLADPSLSMSARVRAQLCLGSGKASIGEPAAANAAANEALETLEGTGLPVGERVNGYAAAASIQLANGDAHRATGLMQRAYKLVEGSDDAHARLVAMDMLGIILASGLEDHAGAEPYMVQAIALAESLGNNEPFRDYNLGLSLIALGRLDDAERAFGKGLAKAAKDGSWDLIRYRIQTNRSDILMAREDYARARSDLEDSITGQRRLRDLQGEAVSHTRLGAVRLADGEYHAALESAQEALRLVEQGGFAREKLDAMRLLVKVRSALGEPEQALATAQQLHALEVQKLKEQNLAGMASLKAQLADEAMAHDNARLQYQSVRARLLRNLAVALLLIVALCGAGVTWFQRRAQGHLRQLGALDPLTGLLNRREAAQRLASLPAAGGRHAVLLIDVDHFKSVNDGYGHGAGDQVLIELAAHLKGACRPADVVARWGGEEFLVACPHLSMGRTSTLAERLRASIAATPFRLPGGGTLAITVSIGFAPFTFFPDSAEGSWQESVRLADRALYAAKHSGRDAWAGLWGLGKGTDRDLRSIEVDPRRAAEEGRAELLGSRPMDWSAVDPAANAAMEAMRVDFDSANALTVTC